MSVYDICICNKKKKKLYRKIYIMIIGIRRIVKYYVEDKTN